MKNNTSQKRVIINALIWGAAMIISSALIEDTKTASAMLFILVAGWVATSSTATRKSIYKAECAFFRKLFRQSNT